MRDVFICDAARTAIGRYAGALAKVRTDDLAAAPIRALVAGNPQADWTRLDEVFLGCRRHWIERRLSSADGRSHCLFTTAAGKEAMVRIEALAAQHERQMVKFIGPDLRQLLLDRLRKFGKS